MEEDGLASEEVLAVGWHPPTIEELALAPEGLEVISFTNFQCLGLSLPLHRFACDLLYFYGLCLHDLMLEGILHIATFITLCEAFLGIEPHFVLWRWLF